MAMSRIGEADLAGCAFALGLQQPEKNQVTGRGALQIQLHGNLGTNKASELQLMQTDM